MFLGIACFSFFTSKSKAIFQAEASPGSSVRYIRPDSSEASTVIRILEQVNYEEVYLRKTGKRVGEEGQGRG